MEEIDCIVIGAGVIGLAIGRELALGGREVIVLEKAGAIGTETSSRNSEVIHAGIYYPPGSLKGRLCVEGKQRLYTYCSERGIAARPIGKLIVATEEGQVPKLAAIKDNAERSGVHDLQWLDAQQAAALEPEVKSVGGLLSPSSGIVNSHAYMLALQGDLETAGGVVAFNSAVQRGSAQRDGIVIATEELELRAKLVVNAAGFYAQALAHAIEGMPNEHIPRRYLAKGNYFVLSGARAPFKHLIYPMPTEASLGIHATIDLGSGVRFGPDVEWVNAIDYTVDEARRRAFAEAVRHYWPAVPENSLMPSYCGIRPKLVGPGEAPADFMIQGPAVHGISGLWHLFGIESPGLTASLALAGELRRRIEA